MKQRILENLPVAGIVAFSGCSVNALAHWMLGWSLNPTPWYWLAALLVEGCTAWLVWSIVDTLRTLTRSRISKQDRRFHKAVFVAFVTLAIPSITASVVANYVEFRGNLLLACLFPVLTIASAVGAGLPDVVKRYEEKKESDRKPKPVRQPKTQLPIIPTLSNKKDRVSWLRDNWPISDIYPADLADIWQVTVRTVSRYLSEIKEVTSSE